MQPLPAGPVHFLASGLLRKASGAARPAVPVDDGLAPGRALPVDFLQPADALLKRAKGFE
jgi:hypothetical protein